MTLPFLTDAEIDELCSPLKMPGAQVRYLTRLGLLVARKPNGRPLLMRSELERVLGAGRFGQQPAAVAPQPRPNIEGFMALMAERKLRKPRKKDPR